MKFGLRINFDLLNRATSVSVNNCVVYDEKNRCLIHVYRFNVLCFIVLLTHCFFFYNFLMAFVRLSLNCIVMCHFTMDLTHC